MPLDTTPVRLDLRADCEACVLFTRGACLTHTCPDCGAVADLAWNAAGELLDTHNCSLPSSNY